MSPGKLNGEGDPAAELKDALLAALEEDWGADRAAVRRAVTRQTARAVAEARLGALLAQCPTPAAFLARPEIQARIIDLALDALFSQPLSPELVLAAEAVALPPLPVHALVFSSFPFAAHELYPLMIDAYVADLEASSERTFQVVAVHERWLTPAGFRRAILFDEDGPRLVEADIAGAVLLCSAQVLALDLTREADSHQRIAAALGDIPLLNPPAGAARLDDKRTTTAIWRASGCPTPQLLEIPARAEPEDIAHALDAFILRAGTHAVLKPFDGTEGRGVELIDLAKAGHRERVVAELATGRMLLMEERGTARFVATGGPVRCTVRINVCWDGVQVWPESGYAQVAATPAEIASAGRGGRIVALDDLGRHLCTADGAPLPFPTADWQRLFALASAGVTTLAAHLGPAMPVLTGIDLLLDVEDGHIAPLLLEANPRPSGMSHSRYIAGSPTDEPGVSRRLWQVVRGITKG